MADVFTIVERSAVMAAIRSSGNKDTELALARILRQNGINGWRRHLPIQGKPDFAFRLERLAVFVDGCFWHGCPKHCRVPRSNTLYWSKKLARNRRRDKVVSRGLKMAGWIVMRIWEHELSNPERITRRIRAALRRQE
ncbi:MAG TPA: very short patch repair endonuclease [Planctomycetota bacterium]|nr:very short patch repair endonuclease [Planctomycetota bacterium]